MDMVPKSRNIYAPTRIRLKGSPTPRCQVFTFRRVSYTMQDLPYAVHADYRHKQGKGPARFEIFACYGCSCGVPPGESGTISSRGIMYLPRTGFINIEIIPVKPNRWVRFTASSRPVYTCSKGRNQPDTSQNYARFHSLIGINRLVKQGGKV